MMRTPAQGLNAEFQWYCSFLIALFHQPEPPFCFLWSVERHLGVPRDKVYMSVSELLIDVQQGWGPDLRVPGFRVCRSRASVEPRGRATPISASGFLQRSSKTPPQCPEPSPSAPSPPVVFPMSLLSVYFSPLIRSVTSCLFFFFDMVSSGCSATYFPHLSLPLQLRVAIVFQVEQRAHC